MSDQNEIKLAYQAHGFVPKEEYRRGRRKKLYNPIHAAPTLARAMEHRGERKFGLEQARRKAKGIILEQEANRHVDSLDWNSLRAFLDTVALFLKAEVTMQKGRKKVRQAMRTFQDTGEARWGSKRLVQRAQQLALKLRDGDNNPNKLKRLEVRIRGSRDKYEALAGLAQYYPLKGVPHQVIDELVGDLGKLELGNFKQLVAYTIVFYDAGKKGWEKR
jgi:hypothetical protein